MKLGFENLQTTAGAENAPVVTIAEALQAGLEAFDMIDSFDGEAVALEGMISGLENLEMVQASVEANGVEASLVAMVGTEVATIAPAILGAKVLDEDGNETEEVKVDVDAVKAELSVAQEGFASKVVDAIKAMIAKIVNFIRGFFDKLGKVGNGIKTVNGEVNASAVDAKVLEGKKLSGLKDEHFSKMITGLGKAYPGVQKLVKLLGMSGTTAETAASESKDIIKSITGTEDGAAPAATKGTYKDLGFDAGKIIGYATPSTKLIADGSSLAGIVDGAAKEVEKALKAEGDAGAQKIVSAIVKELNKTVSVMTKMILKVSVQELNMLKAVKSAQK